MNIFNVFQIYHLGLNTLVSNVIPLTLMTYLNICICTAIRKKTAADRAEFCTLRTQSQGNCKLLRTNSYRVQLPEAPQGEGGGEGGGADAKTENGGHAHKHHHIHHIHHHSHGHAHVHANGTASKGRDVSKKNHVVHSEIDDDDEVASLMATGKDMETSLGANEVVITVAGSHSQG